jgi:hypothetical protein
MCPVASSSAINKGKSSAAVGAPATTTCSESPGFSNHPLGHRPQLWAQNLAPDTIRGLQGGSTSGGRGTAGADRAVRSSQQSFSHLASPKRPQAKNSCASLRSVVILRKSCCANFRDPASRQSTNRRGDNRLNSNKSLAVILPVLTPSIEDG